MSAKDEFNKATRTPEEIAAEAYRVNDEKMKRKGDEGERLRREVTAAMKGVCGRLGNRTENSANMMQEAAIKGKGSASGKVLEQGNDRPAASTTFKDSGTVIVTIGWDVSLEVVRVIDGAVPAWTPAQNAEAKRRVSDVEDLVYSVVNGWCGAHGVIP